MCWRYVERREISRNAGNALGLRSAKMFILTICYNPDRTLGGRRDSIEGASDKYTASRNANELQGENPCDAKPNDSLT
jgi:hypothetical protein